MKRLSLAAAVLFLLSPRQAVPAFPLPVCISTQEAASGGSWLLVYRYVVNVQEEDSGAPIYETRETFDGRRFPSEAAAYCGAEQIRRTGVVLPTIPRFGRDSNVIPESITPMPSLLAMQLGIKPAR